MATQHIGLIVGTTTRKLLAVLNPKEDADFDNPRHLLTLKGDLHIDEDPIMVHVERGAFEMVTNHEEVDVIVDVALGSYMARQPEGKAAHSHDSLIGMVVGTTTRTVYTLTNPTSNHELDNPRLLLFQPEMPEPVRMVIQPRGTREDEMAPDEVQARIDYWYAERAMSEAPDGGPDHVTT